VNRVRFLDFRVNLQSYAQSVGSVLGVCVNNIPALAGLVNVATERLISDPMAPEEGWWGGWAKYSFNVIPGSPYIVMPRGVARIIVLDVCTKPVKLQNGFYEFLDYGEGLQPKPCKENICGGFMQTYDRESTPILGNLLPTPQIVRVVPTDPRDVDKTVLIQGTDQNGKVVTTTDPVTNQTILGEIVTLALPFSDTITQFLDAPNSPGITGIQKDVTAGPVTFFQADPNSGESSPLSSMEPSETSAAYRKYFIGNLPCGCCTTPTGQTQVVAMCKLEYVPISSDPDYLGIPCVPALIAEVEALRYENMDSVKAQQMGMTKHAKALQLLAGQLQHYLGNERPAITVPLFGTRKQLRYQPI
jgi:hypothetical protein